MRKLSHAKLGALVQQARQGDMDAFAEIYEHTAESQLYFATAFLKDAALAEDVVQEVYISLYKNLHRIEDGTLLVAYLRRICYNICVDFRKKQLARRAELGDEALELQTDNNVSNCPHDSYASMEANSELHQALAALPDGHRAAFLMRYYHNMRISEIAAAINISESTVKRYTKHAAETMRGML